MEAAAQHFGLKTGLAGERDESACFERAVRRPKLFDNAHSVVRNVTHPEQPRQAVQERAHERDDGHRDSNANQRNIESKKS